MRRPAARLALYAAGVEAATWAALVPLTAWQQARGTLPDGALDERLGRISLRPREGLRVVVHAVSLGELASARGLLEVLSKALPGVRVTLTVGTAAARAVAARLAGQLNVDAVQYLPWDRPHAIRAWLSAWDPALVVVLETELWPGLLDECRRLEIPVALVSARVYPGDVARYRSIRGFFAPLLDGVALVAAQSVEERRRLIAIGAPADRTMVTGDLKAVGALHAPPLSGQLVQILGGARGLIVAGSTHDPEEQWLLDAFTVARRAHPEARLALAPRATARARQVARTAGARGFAVTTTTSARRCAWDVLVVDEPGVLAGLYGHADLAVVGGSLVAHGGHSLLEAAASGVPVICGPHTAHVTAQVARLGEAGALVHVDRASLPDALAALLADAGRRHTMGRAACDVVSALASEAAQVAAHLRPLVSAREGRHTSERAAV